MGKPNERDRRRFLQDLDRLMEAVSQPLRPTSRSAPRTRDSKHGDLIWRLRAEPEEPAFPCMFRLTWGVRVPGVLEEQWPPGTPEARQVRPDYDGALWVADVEQLRTGKDRIYKYRVGAPKGALSRLNPFGQDKHLPLDDMSEYLSALVEETVAPLMHRIRGRNDLAAWMQDNSHLCGHAHMNELLAVRTGILQRG